MIHIKRVRLPESLQAFARRENGAVVVYVSAALPAAGRTAAIRRALSAAPEAGWRSPRSPVVLPALAGGARLPLAPDGRWAYRALLAAAVAGVAAVIAVATVIALAGGPHRAAGSPAALRPAASPSGPAPARSGSGAGRGTGTSASPVPGSTPGNPGAHGNGGQPAAGGGPAPEASGTPSPIPTPTATGSPSPAPTPVAGPTPSPSPTPVKQSSGCVTVLGVTICL
jgi:hypothetical protein